MSQAFWVFVRPFPRLQVPATLPSPSLSENPEAIAVLPHFGADHSLRSCFRKQNFHLYTPKIFPEPSNSGSLPGKAGGFPIGLKSARRRARYLRESSPRAFPGNIRFASRRKPSIVAA